MRFVVIALVSAWAVFGQVSGRVDIIPRDATAVGDIRFFELRSNGGNFIGLKAPTNITADLTFQLPGADGSAGQCLTTNGSKALSFAPCSDIAVWTRMSGLVRLTNTGDRVVLGGTDNGLDKLQVNGSTMAQHVVPSVTTTYDLGSDGSIWNTMRTRYARMDQIELTKPTDRTNNWRITLSSDGTNFFLKENSLQDVVLQLESSQMSFTGHLNAYIARHWQPNQDVTWDLGNTPYRWRKLFVKDIDMTGSCTGCPATAWNDTGTVVRLNNPGRNVSIGADTNTGSRLEVYGNTLAQHLYPQATATYDLGADSSIWNVMRSKYSRVDQIELTKPSDRTNSWKIRLTSDGLKLMILENSLTNPVLTFDSDALSFTGSLNSYMYRNFRPAVDGGYHLGSPSYRWGSIYAMGPSQIWNNLLVGGSGADNRIFAVSQDSSVSTQLFSYSGYGGFVGTNTAHHFYIRTADVDRAVWSSSGAFYQYGYAEFNSWVRAATFQLYDGVRARVHISHGGNGNDNVRVIEAFNSAGATTFYTDSLGVTWVNNLTVAGTCTGCGGGGTAAWARNAGGYLYPTTTNDSVVVGGSGAPGAKLDVQGGGIRSAGSLLFAANAAYDIGNTTNRAGTIYATNINITGTCTGCGGTGGNVGQWTVVGSTLYPSTSSNNVTIGGTSNSFGSRLEVYGDSTLSGHVVPGTNAFYDLGSSSKIWSVVRSVYSRMDQIELTKSTDRTNNWRMTLSSDGLSFWLKENSLQNIVLNIDSDAMSFTGALNAYLARHWKPMSNSTYDLGSGAYAWRNLYLTGSVVANGSTGMSGSPYCSGGIKGLYISGGVVTGYSCN